MLQTSYSWTYIPANQQNFVVHELAMHCNATNQLFMNIPANQQNFDNPRTLAPTNKYDFTVMLAQRYYSLDINPPNLNPLIWKSYV